MTKGIGLSPDVYFPGKNKFSHVYTEMVCHMTNKESEERGREGEEKRTP